MYGRVESYQDFIEACLPKGPGGQRVRAHPDAGDVLETFLGRIEARWKRLKHEPEWSEVRRVLEHVVERFGLDDHECEVTYLTMDVEPYGDYQTHIGLQIARHNMDVYDKTLVWTAESGFEIESWGNLWESWEEEEYGKDPFPKIRHDGPQGSEDICTPDFVRFYAWDYGVNPDADQPIFTLPFHPENDDACFPRDGEANLDDVDERRWWVEFFKALATAERVRKRSPGAYWVDRRLDYFWKLRKRTYGNRNWEPDDFCYCPGKLRQKIEALVKWQARGAMRKKRGPDQPTPREFRGESPVAGDLFTDHWHAMMPHGITFYEVVEVPKRDPNTGLPGKYGHVARQGPAAFTITRREIQQRVGWARLIHEVRSRPYKVRVWSGSPFSKPSTWTLIDVPRQLPDLRGLAGRRRRQ